ncbi:MAG: hypothetical protein OXI33_11755 [Chloroflexota bacterium]|nr:hypothetical protein [Chloroflexota bacterium]
MARVPPAFAGAGPGVVEGNRAAGNRQQVSSRPSSLARGAIMTPSSEAKALYCRKHLNLSEKLCRGLD